MKAMKSIQAILTFTLLLLSVSVATATPLGTAFTYQGRLTDGTNVANGSYDLKSTVYDALADGNAVGGPLTNTLTTDSNGVFTVALDFGSDVFDGDARWLEVGVRTNGSTDDFTLLSPRQPLTAAPHALYAPSAGTAASVAATNLTGTVAEARIDAAIARDSEIFPTVLANDGPGSGLEADLLDGFHGSAFWKLSGNAGTTPGVDFLGTTDNQALELKVNNIRALRLEPTAAGGPNVIGGSALNSIAVGVNTATIGGGEGNAIGVNAHRATICGGATNTIGNDAQSSVIAGGRWNDIGVNSDCSAVGGGYSNNIAANAYYSAIGGGQYNGIGTNSLYSAIGGGCDNNIAADSRDSTIAGGAVNNIAADSWYSTIAGGAGNNIGTNSDYSAIAGGSYNDIGTDAENSAMGGGYNNNIGNDSYSSVIAGGRLNDIGTNSRYSFIGGGENNDIGADSWYATIAAGDLNDIGINADSSAIGGGYDNGIADNSSSATIAGGVGNDIGTNSQYSSIGGGNNNNIAADSCDSTIAGGSQNDIGINSDYSAIGGGYDNNIAADATSSVIAGGNGNNIAADATFSAIAGGCSNNIRSSADICFIGGGKLNAIGTNAYYSVIGGGVENTVGTYATFSTIAGGQMNGTDYDASYGAIGGGYSNRIGGGSSMIPGGFCNYAASYAFAAGRRAKANHTGAFVWGDSTDADFASTAADQVSFRCNGGVRFTSGSGGANQTVSWAPGSGSWSFSSDRNLKENFEPLNQKEILNKVAGLPLSRWNYRGYALKHIGPMAQDFHAAFALGGSDTMIDGADLDGVALAAIQGLNQKVEQQRAILETKDSRIAELEQRLTALETFIKSTMQKGN